MLDPNPTIICAILGGIGGSLLGGCFVFDFVEGWRLYRAFHGDTREQTLKKIRAEVQVMRQEYAKKPADRFAVELLEMCDRLEQTMAQVEAEA